MTTELFMRLFANDYGYLDNISILMFYIIVLIWFILLISLINAKSWLTFPFIIFPVYFAFGFSTATPENVPKYGTKVQKETMVHCVNQYFNKVNLQDNEEQKMDIKDITDKNIDVIMKECYKQDQEKLNQENSTKTRIFQKELDKIMENQGYSN